MSAKDVKTTSHSPDLLRRQEPLPEQCPKPAHEDPQAAQRVAILLASPSYREADSDTDFLRPPTRAGLGSNSTI